MIKQIHVQTNASASSSSVSWPGRRVFEFKPSFVAVVVLLPLSLLSLPGNPDMKQWQNKGETNFTYSMNVMLNPLPDDKF